MIRTTAAACSIALVLTSSQPASALMVVGQPAPPPTSMTLAAGGGFAVGIIGTAALLCLYDVWLKINGYKNWDGSPKVVQVQAQHHHR